MAVSVPRSDVMVTSRGIENKIAPMTATALVAAKDNLGMLNQLFQLLEV
jgi:hypothetical protein